MAQKISQEEMDALLKDSILSESEFRDSRQPLPPREEDSHGYTQEEFESYQESYQRNPRAPLPSPHPEESYGGEEFESYEDSRNPPKSHSQTGPIGKAKPPRQKLEDIREEPSPQVEKGRGSSKEKPRPKTGIYFYPAKQSPAPAADRKHLPHNYARLQEREKELLLTTLSEENRQLKEELGKRDGDYGRLEKTYKQLLQEKAHQAASVREGTLEKQLSSLQGRFDKLQHLCKLEREKNTYRPGKSSQGFVATEQAGQREEELLEIIDKLKERLVSTDTELKTLQRKMGEGENYIDELKRKMKRVEQLEFKMEKMAGQAEDDRDYITHLKENNARAEQQLFEAHKEKRLLEVEVRRYELGQATQADTLSELEEVRREKDMLERNLRDFATSMNGLQKSKGRVQWGTIEDSGELLKP